MSQLHRLQWQGGLVELGMWSVCCSVQRNQHLSQRVNVQRGQNKIEERQAERRLECLQLRVFKSLLTSHATAMCTRRNTCRGWECSTEGTRGRASTHVGGAHRGEAYTATGRLSLLVLLDFRLNIWSLVNDDRSTDIQRKCFAFFYMKLDSELLF